MCQPLHEATGGTFDPLRESDLGLLPRCSGHRRVCCDVAIASLVLEVFARIEGVIQLVNASLAFAQVSVFSGGIFTM